MAEETKADVIYNKAKGIRDEILVVRQMKCTCSGFVIQYQGCSCERGKRRKRLSNRIDEFFEGL